MSTLHRWQTTSAALMAMAITTTAVIPIMSFSPAQAQSLFNQSNTVTIPGNRNVTFPVRHDKQKVVVSRGETLNLTLKISNDITDSARRVLIPRNTQVVGRLEPVYFNTGNRSNENVRGVRFVAEQLIYPSGSSQPINAASGVVTTTDKITRNNTGRILTDAAYGAGVATAISLITGNRRVEILEPLGGAAAGALASILLRREEVEVFVVRPEQDLRLVLNSDLVVNPN